MRQSRLADISLWRDFPYGEVPYGAGSLYITGPLDNAPKLPLFARSMYLYALINKPHPYSSKQVRRLHNNFFVIHS
jgi:hypothetical protein